MLTFTLNDGKQIIQCCHKYTRTVNTTVINVRLMMYNSILCRYYVCEMIVIKKYEFDQTYFFEIVIWHFFDYKYTRIARLMVLEKVWPLTIK